MKGWYGKKVTVLTALFMVLCLTGFGMLKLEFGPSGSGEGRVLSVIIEHHGVESTEMERTAAIPLEEGLSGISGLSFMRTVSEYGRTRAELTLKKSVSYAKFYLELRDAVEGVYRTMPASFQKPRIVSGRSDDRPVFIVSFGNGKDPDKVRAFVEKEVKPRMEKIDGAGEIEVGGGGLRELHIYADMEKTAVSGVSLSAIAGQTALSQVKVPLGSLSDPLRELPLFAVGQADGAEDFRALLFRLPGGSTVSLGDLADIEWALREGDSISRVNGSKRIVLYARAGGTANLLLFCRELKSVLDSVPADAWKPEILLDEGRFLQDSLIQLIEALCLSMLLVTSVFVVFRMGCGKIIMLGLFLPLNLAVSAALVAAFGLNLDHFILTGFSLGLGMIADAGIIIVESGFKPGEIRRPLLSSILTTIIVIVPLMAGSSAVPGLRQLALAMVLMLTVSPFLGLIFLPAFAEYGAPGKKKRRSGTGAKTRLRPGGEYRPVLSRIVPGLAGFAAERPWLPVSAAVLVTAAAAVSAATMGRDFGNLWDDGTVFAHAEFESGSTLEFSDERIALLTAALGGGEGRGRVETLARAGSGSISVSPEVSGGRLTAADRIKAEETLVAAGRSIPGCFIYVPQPADGTGRSVELAFYGDDYSRLKDLALDAAAYFRRDSAVTGVVLHFKEEPPACVYRPDPVKSLAAGIYPSRSAEALRIALQGPVMFKWIFGNPGQRQELDVRVMGKGKAGYTRSDLDSIPVAGPGGTSRVLGELGSFIQCTEPSRIYRQNRQRAVFLTVHADAASTDHLVRLIEKRLSSFPMPAGYTCEIDRSVRDLGRRIAELVKLLILSAVLVYMVLAAQFESLSRPFPVMAVIPVSLAFPLVFLRLAGQPLTAPVLVGLVMLSGLAVNNGILIADSAGRAAIRGCAGKKLRIMLAVKKRLRPMLLTSLTTILGAVPLLFIRGAAGGFMRSLALVMMTGMTGSVFAALVLLPALLGLSRQSAFSRGPR